MNLRSLRIQNFRNIGEASLEFPNGPQLLIGKNGQGKTSLLEAVYFLATATSHRTRQIRELIRKGQEKAFVVAEYDKGGESHRIGTGILPGKREFRLDGRTLPRSSEIYGHLRAVFFSPEDLNFVHGSPHVRRRSLDLGLCQQHPSHLRNLLEYRRVLKQRNRILKADLSEKEKTRQVSAWDPSLARLGAAVTRARAKYGLQLIESAAGHYRDLSLESERLLGDYRSTAKRTTWSEPDRIPSETDLESAFAGVLSEHRGRDLQVRNTEHGPHRDDLVLKIGGISAHRYASQGQRRSAALAVKLAERDLLMGEGSPPILLVDDVTHEMDEGRCQVFLQKILESGQAFFTFTEETGHRGIIRKATQWSVSEGTFHPHC